MSITYDKGVYRGEITQQALGKNKNGSPELAFKARVLQKQNGDAVAYQYERTIRLYLSEAAFEYSLDKLKGLGFDGSSARELSSFNFVGHECDMKCDHEQNRESGDWFEKWDLMWGSSTPLEVHQQLTGADSRMLDSLFGKSGGTKTTAPAARKSQPVAAGITDDDVPF